MMATTGIMTPMIIWLVVFSPPLPLSDDEDELGEDVVGEDMVLEVARVKNVDDPWLCALEVEDSKADEGLLEVDEELLELEVVRGLPLTPIVVNTAVSPKGNACGLLQSQ